jgi:3-oxoacyl-[acyl-carrier-protein] synthase III
MEKEGVLDPQRMRPRFTPRPDTEISMMAEIAVAAAKQALERAGKTAADVDLVIVRQREHAARLPRHGGRNPDRAGHLRASAST